MAVSTRLIFITGTDTGVGKTILTALLLHHLRSSSVHALAVKPFCSGGTTDVDLLHAIQEGELTKEQINPFYFEEPIAPLAALRLHGGHVGLKHAVTFIRDTARLCECLLIEGAGGLMAPLGERYTIHDFIIETRGEAIIVAANRLGTINHTLLTAMALTADQKREIPLKVVLMNHAAPDPSSASNFEILQEWLEPIPLVNIGFLGQNPADLRTIRECAKHLETPLAEILARELAVQ